MAVQVWGLHSLGTRPPPTCRRWPTIHICPMWYAYKHRTTAFQAPRSYVQTRGAGRWCAAARTTCKNRQCTLIDPPLNEATCYSLPRATC